MFYKRVCNHVVDHVCPTKRNGLIPRILQKQSIWAILGVGVALFGFSQLMRVTDYLNIKAEVYPKIIVEYTNKDRATAGLSPLSVNTILEEAAELKVEDMVNNSYFAHTSPAGINPWHWFKQAGYSFVYAGENLAVNFTDSVAVENAWIASPSHRANIMNPNFTEIGVATAKGYYQGAPTTFVVQLFGSPAVTNVVSTPAPQSPKITSVNSANLVDNQKNNDNDASDISNKKESVVAGESIAKTTEQKSAVSEVKNKPSIINEQKDIAKESQENNVLFTSVNNPEATSVVNIDPNIVQTDVAWPTVPKVSFWARLILNINQYIGLIIELIVVALIMATATIVVRERQRHHKVHMAYGILTTIVLTSFLFIGRIGVFAEASSNRVLIVENSF